MDSGGEFGLEAKLAHDPAWMKRPFVLKLLKNLPVIILVGSLFLLYGYFLSHKIDLVTADLGRHIKNGEILFQDSSVLSKNLYSYAHPDFPVVNHHWGSGMLFYFAWRQGGFVGVHLFFILLSLAAFFFFLLAAKERAGWGIAGLISLLALPLLAERTEIRPEVFSYLFAGLFFLVLCRFSKTCHPRPVSEYGINSSGDPGGPRNATERLDSSFRSPRKAFGEAGWNDKKKAERLLWLLPFIQILWVNTHIYFLLGPLLVGAFLLESAIQYRARFAKLLSVFAAVLAATLVNPLGYRAITEAVTLFQNFGYRLAENQSVWFLERLGMTNPNFLIFKVALTVLVLSYLAVLLRNRAAFRLSSFFVAAGMSTLALLAVRNFALFGLFFIPILAENIAALFPTATAGNRPTRTAAWCAAAALVFSLVFVVPRFFPYWHAFGIGLESGNLAAAEFIQANGVSGPIFNNYDIGGYLIFTLFPAQRVFVDNRPEAYPAEFFQSTYIPMQEDEAVWRRELLRYQFNAIVFSYRDATPWGQKFLAARIADPAWAPVFVDGKVLVFIRRTEANAALIETREISRDVFLIR